eukprot:scaffold648438_cov53-Prasinocladus_malaysianus.AAC.1
MGMGLTSLLADGGAYLAKGEPSGGETRTASHQHIPVRMRMTPMSLAQVFTCCPIDELLETLLFDIGDASGSGGLAAVDGDGAGETETLCIEAA